MSILERLKMSKKRKLEEVERDVEDEGPKKLSLKELLTQKRTKS